MKGNDILFVVFIVGLGIAGLISGGSGQPLTEGGLFGFQAGNSSSGQPTTISSGRKLTQQEIAAEVSKAERDTQQVSKDIQTIKDNREASIYKGSVAIQNISYGSTDPSNEYISIYALSQNKNPIKITGWTFKSLSTGNSATIGKGTYLFFGDGQDSKSLQDIYLSPGDTAYISTGRSPLSVSFKVNRCSGYQSQSITFNPYLFTDCPLARNEKNNIPPTVKNDSCFDLIDSFPQCRVRTEPLPLGTSPECSNFIASLNYRSCVDTHKNEAGFYKPEWRIYLGRSEILWKTRRETIKLLDDVGKTVDTRSY